MSRIRSKDTKPIPSAKIKFFQEGLLKWFKNNGRHHFPWRNKSASNYQLIISEVLLQRTKAETVARFYPGFIKQFPSWKNLDAVSKKQLEKALQPIGLFRQRAASIKRLSREMVKRNGRFPKDRGEIDKLPAVGQYIGNAIDLFINKKPSPLIDVNMARVLERFFGKRKLADIRHDPYLQKLALDFVRNKNSKELNWAILDFASLICKAKQPICNNCLISLKCLYINKLNGTSRHNIK